MLPTITGLYAGLAAILFICLSINVIRNRRRFRIGLGDGGNESLLNAIRIHGNAIEYIPITLLLMAFVEMQDGLAGLWLHLIGIIFIVGRVLHVMGLCKSSGTSMGRRNGIVLSLLILLVLAIINIALFFNV